MLFIKFLLLKNLQVAILIFADIKCQNQRNPFLKSAAETAAAI